MHLIPVKSHILATVTLIPVIVKKCIVYVNGPAADDRRRMILCENEHCSSVTRFHFECLNIIRKPRSKWFCPNCKIKK